MKGIGLMLLFLGVGIIAYAFNPSDYINSAVSSAVDRMAANFPGNETAWMLIGGSGAVVAGMTMIFMLPAKPKAND